MARSITYEGDTIQATPRETDGKKWRLHICMSGNDHLGVRTSEFPAEGLCATEQEADISAMPHREPADPRTRFLLGTAYLYARHRMAAHDRGGQRTMGGRAHVRAGLRAAP